MLELDNGIVHVGADLSYGGSITWLSASGQAKNLINNHDRGRQVQQSYYAGHALDRRKEGQREGWSPWSWNPIGAGDCYGNAPEIVESSNDGSTIYVKIIPLLWDMDNEAAECDFESWITLSENTVHVRNRLTCRRTDSKWNAVACHQELPAVYTIGDLDRLYTYEGPAPFTNAPLKQIANNGPPWAYWGGPNTQEKWAAYVNTDNWGVGVYNPRTELFAGGFSGTPGGDTYSASTGYISPLCVVKLDKDTVYEYDYHLVLGSLDEIRAFAYRMEGH
jgi:hypothetical protein